MNVLKHPHEATAVIDAAEALTTHFASPISELPSLQDIQTHMMITAKLIDRLTAALAAFYAVAEEEE